MKKDPSHKDSGFRLPDDYFSDLEGRIRERMEETDRSGTLPAKDGFAVPEGYFKNLSDRIVEHAKTAEPTPGVIPLNRRLWKYAVAAAITVLFVSSTWMILNNNQSSTPESLSLSDIEWLLDQGVLEIPQQYLIEEANDKILNEITMADNILDEELLENYLTEESDLYEIIE